MGYLQLIKPNLHRVQVGQRKMLFHIPSSSLFEMDELSNDMIKLFETEEQVSSQTLQQRFSSNYSVDDVCNVLNDFKSMELVAPTNEVARYNPKAKSIAQLPLNTLVLNTNTGCNLSCTYCYKEDLNTPSQGKKMAFDTAMQAIELMLKESPEQEKYNIVFFGGEPLSNMPLIREVVAACEQRFAEHGAPVDFSLTTNATLLTPELIEWFNTHRFGLTVSMDGPKVIHDKNRLTVGGMGTYDVVRQKVDLLLKHYTAKPVGCRVTLTRGITDVETIFQHLYHEVGFHEVGFGPVTSSDIASFNLDEQEMQQVFQGMKALGKEYLTAALEHRHFGFSNLHQLMTDIHEGNKKQLPCGAGVGLLAVDHAGGFNLCHRFTGSELPTFGDTKQGIDKPQLIQFVSQRLERKDTGCETCRVRNLCSGGCYHESYVKYGSAEKPAYHYCDLIRDWIDYGIELYTTIMIKNPAFFDAFITPRRSAR